MVRCSGGTVALLTAATAIPVLLVAQDDQLRRAFEGKTVVLKLDMPGDDSGISIYPLREDPVDYRKVGDAIKRYGAALRKGDEVVVTKVHVKPKLIEFQLGGGGYGAWGDTTSRPSVPSTYVPKSNREKDLERERDGAAGDRRRALDRELSDVRNRREREEARLRIVANRAEIEQRQWEQERRLRSGSRFNLHYPNGVSPEAASPEAIMAALREYVEFSNALPRQSSLQTRQPPKTAPNPAALKKGMSEEEVDSVLGGPPQSRRNSEAGGLPMVNATYDLPGSSVTAQFVNGVLARFTISSK